MARLDRRMSVEPTFKFSAAWLADVTFDMNPHVTAKDMSVMLFLVGMAVAQCERDKVLSDVPIRLEMRQFLARTMIQSRAVAEKSFVRIEDMNISGAPVFARLPQVDDGMFVCDVSRIVIQAASYEWADTPEPVDPSYPGVSPHEDRAVDPASRRGRWRGCARPPTRGG